MCAQCATLLQAPRSHDRRLASIIFRQRDCDAVVMDSVLPDVDGVDTLGELHRQHRMPRATVIAGFPELLDEISPRLATVGVDTMIQNPLEFSEVDDALARLH